MDKATILRLFLSYGTQVDQNALDFLVMNPSFIEQILKSERNKLPSVITLEFLKSLPTTNMINFSTEKISTTQLNQILTYRYEFLKNLLVNKPELVNLVSINKITEKLKQFSVIGVVLKKNSVVVLEDTTGQAKFNVDNELAKYIVEDEVVGFVCERQMGVSEVKSVICPDIPLKKENKKTKNLEECFFISDLHMDLPSFNTIYYKNFLNWLESQKNLKIFVLGGVSSKKEDVSKFLNDVRHATYLYSEETIGNAPAVVKIEDIQILLSHGSFLQRYINLWSTQVDVTLINLLRKRNLNPRLTPDYYTNSFLLETIPDVVVISGTNKSTSTNYKGTTILTTGSFVTEPIYWLINLQTRETFKIDLS